MKKILVVVRNWDTARTIGYWRIEGSLIKTEYFTCANYGSYIRKQGEIKGDTIIFERICGANPFKSTKRPKEYIL